VRVKSIAFTVILALLTLSGVRGWTQADTPPQPDTAAPPDTPAATEAPSAPETRASSGAPEEPLHPTFFVEPLLQKGLGGTAYDLSYDAGGGVTGLSRLEFPQISLEAGAVLGLALTRGTRRQWLFEAAFTHSTLAMPGTMYDYDWWEFPGIPKTPYSYTYSTDSTVNWRAGVDAAYTLASTGPWLLALYGMYRFQYTSHVEDTYTGWQYVWNSTKGAYDLDLLAMPTTDVLEYSLSSHTIGIGLLGSVQPIPRFSVELRSAFTPVYAFDSDDHKLRTKLSTASGWGVGFYADLKAVYRLNRIAKTVTPYFVLSGDFNYFVVNTLQTQYWYGNNDAANGAPQGTLVTGIGHVITSSQLQIALRFGFSF
jgi:hypothetical protein